MSGLCPGCFEIEVIGSEPCPNCGWNSSQQRFGIHLEPGQHIYSRYILGRVLGQGGFGITYLGFDNKCPPEVVDRFENDKLKILNDYAQNMPKKLTKIIHKALALKPEDRFQTVEEFQQSLFRCFAGQLRQRST